MARPWRSAERGLAASGASRRIDQPAGAAGIIGHDVRSVRISEDGDFVATIGRDGTARVFTIAGRELWTSPGRFGAVNTIALTRPKVVLTGGEDGAVRLWNFTTGKMVDQLYGHSSVVRSLAVVPSSRSSSYRFASGADDGRIRLWRRPGRGAPSVLAGHSAEVNSIAYSPDWSPPGLGSRRRRGSDLECHIQPTATVGRIRFAGAVDHLHPRRRARRGGMRGWQHRGSWPLARLT